MDERSEDPTDVAVVAAIEAGARALSALANAALGAVSPWDEYSVTIEKPAMQGFRPEPFRNMHGSVPTPEQITPAIEAMRAALALFEGLTP